MLPKASSGEIELRHVVTRVRARLRRTRFVLGKITRIDLDAREVQVRHPVTGDVSRLAYARPVLALGSGASS